MLKSLTLLACAAVAAAAPSANAGAGAAIPVQRSHHNVAREDGTIDERAFFDMLNRAIGKYRSDAHIDIDWSKYESVEKRGKVALKDYVLQGVDEEYYGPGKVGATTPQTFTFDFDTGSSDTFIPGPGCKGCAGGARYDQGGINRHKMTSVTYGSGQVSGNDYYDTVCVGGLCANRQNVISLKNAQGFNSVPSNSLMGMAFQSIAASGQPPFFTNLVRQGKVSPPEFGFYLGRKSSGTAGQSEMYLGGRDASKFTGPVTNVPLSNESYWQLKLDALTLGGSTVPGSPGNAAIDTGTTIIFAPTAVASALFAQIPGAAPAPGLSGSPQLTLFLVPCGNTKIPQIKFAGQPFNINPKDFTIGKVTGLFKNIINDISSKSPFQKDKRQLLPSSLPGIPGLGSGECVASIAGFDVDPAINLYVVGDAFLKNYYSIFNMGAKPYVGFAKAVKNYGA